MSTIEFLANSELVQRVPSFNGITTVDELPTEVADKYRICWGAIQYGDVYIEQGFFTKALWLDKRGAYLDSSLRDSTLFSLLEKYALPATV